MKRTLAAITVAIAALYTIGASAQETKVAIGYSGWTGFAPLTLAKEAGIFKKNGLDVTMKKIPQKDRHLAIASGDIQCAATTVETWIVTVPHFYRTCLMRAVNSCTRLYTERSSRIIRAIFDVA